ncbi:MAG: ribonuclease D [Oscillatoriales cyanobacterium]|uniref:Ribonuclease D n=1 Tax=Microcoleus anatoxicus PTRS2 TaxID=2705321 RepID=A0ABU8YM79_9CYAN|nr:MAG: ribonuclease D [Oscillatoriales cyanobacterium]TAD93507.1 MAG: ribonuclease D [Oscillatoriales cyanobacterium]TAE01530.1 MAG: ribonuclease D [Oscillatoriales cyanobacterium]TAF06627.1 MAG: ribonuclease D [Oscillatoriales cyanobacterium]TAF69000.1 MAG: ribonuclease D [Oscillatoriales cyanobacterium]
MPYLTVANDIKALIAKFAQSRILWIDTEIADYKSNPRLSLIQVLADPRDLTGDATFLLDVLDQPELVTDFISLIMVNPNIEKVMHNASYDIRFLGNDEAKNVTCSLNLSRKIPYYILPLPNRKLKTLIEKVCNINYVDKTEQGSDWGKRPLTEKQVEYAKMDVVYLARVHRHLLEIFHKSYPEPASENLTALGDKYQTIEARWKPLDSELAEVKERIKTGMLAKKLKDSAYFELSSSIAMKVDFMTLTNLTQAERIELHFPVTLTKEIQRQLGQLIEHPSLEVEEVQSWRLLFNAQQRRKSTNQIAPRPVSDDLIVLGERYKEILPEWKFLDSEVDHLKERVKKAMMAQNKGNTPHFKLSSSCLMKVDFASLARLVQSVGIELDFRVTLTQYIQKRLGEAINQIDVQIEYITSWRMRAKTVEDEDEEIPF